MNENGVEGRIEVYFVASTINCYIQLGNGTGDTEVSYFDNVTVKKVNKDGYWHDRATGDCIIKNDAGTPIESGDIKLDVPVSMAQIKGRSVANRHNVRFDGLRGVTNSIITNATDAESLNNAYGVVTAFTSDGFTVDDAVNVNENTTTYISYQTLYTHIKWGLTNHGKKYVVAYNPKTNEVLPMWIGSGLAGHQIPSPIGVALDYLEVKNLDTVKSWAVYSGDETEVMQLDLTNASAATDVWNDTKPTNSEFILGSGSLVNTENDAYIGYGKAKSETWTIVSYTGTAVNNSIEVKDVNGNLVTPKRVIPKRIDSTGSWEVYDSERGNDLRIFFDTSGVEAGSGGLEISSTGFTLTSNNSYNNASGGQYIALVYFDTNSDGGGSYDDLASDTTQLNLTDRQMMFADGYVNGHANNTAEYNTGTETITPDNGWSDGNNYVYKEEDGLWYSTLNEPRFGGVYEKKYASDNGHVFEAGKFYLPTDGELVTNGKFDTDISGWTIGTTETTAIWESGTMKITDTGADHDGVYQSFSVVAGNKYTLSGFYDSDGTANIYASIFDGLWTSNSDTNTPLLLLGGAVLHEDFTGEFTASSSTITVRLHCGTNASGNFDNVSVYKLEATLDTPLATPITYLDKTIEVSAGEIVDAHEFNYPDTVLDVVKVAGGFDLGQSWIDETGNRMNGIDYKNTTGKPIMVSARVSNSAVESGVTGYVDGEAVILAFDTTGLRSDAQMFIVPPNSVYSLDGFNVTGVVWWKEYK